jgi:hypothetical protein
MIRLAESQIFKRKMTQPFKRRIGRKFASADLLKQFTNEFRVGL